MSSSRHAPRSKCDCGEGPTFYHNSNWICARCRSLENRLVKKTYQPRDRAVRRELPEYAVCGPAAMMI